MGDVARKIKNALQRATSRALASTPRAAFQSFWKALSKPDSKRTNGSLEKFATHAL